MYGFMVPPVPSFGAMITLMGEETSPGQQRVLQIIQEAIRESGAAPTLQEIAAELGKSTGAVQAAIQALAAKGYIEIVPRKARGIRLTERSALQDVRVTELRAALEAALEESTDLPILFRVAQENLPKVFRMETGILWVKDAPRRRFLGPRDFGMTPPAPFRDELPVRCQARTEPLWVVDRKSGPETPVSALFAPDVRSYLIVPVMDEERFLALLAFASTRPAKNGAEETLEAARAAAEFLLKPLRRAEAQFRLQEDLKLHRLLLDLVKELTSELDLEPLLRRIFGIVEKLVPVDAMWISVKNKDGDYEALLETDLDDRDQRVFFPVPRIMEPDTSKTMVEVEQRRYVLVNRTPEELRRIAGKVPSGAPGDPWYPAGNPARRSASLLFVPIWFGKDFQGALSVQSYRLNAYRHEDAERLRVIGEYIGLALRNARRVAGR